jgi:hypothetical protein
MSTEEETKPIEATPTDTAPVETKPVGEETEAPKEQTTLQVCYCLVLNIGV